MVLSQYLASSDVSVEGELQTWCEVLIRNQGRPGQNL